MLACPGGLLGDRNKQPRALIHLETGRLHHLAPLVGVIDNELGEVRRGDDEGVAPEVGHACLDRRISKCRVDLLIQTLNNFGWRSARSADAEPSLHVVTLEGLTNCRNIRQGTPAFRGCHPNGSQLA